MILNDRAILAAAWTIIVGVAGFAVWRTSQQPSIDPSVAALARQLDLAMKDRAREGHGPAGKLGYVTPELIWCTVSEAGTRPAPKWTNSLWPRFIGEGIPKTKVHVFLLPEARPAGVVDLDGAVIRWSLAEGEAALQPHMIRKAAKPTGFAIERQCEDGPAARIAELGPDARSYTDLAAEPNRTYRYWVFVRGEETDLAAETPERKAVARSLSDSVELRPPSPHRVTLMGGGDRGSALLKVESYDRTHKKWIGRNVTALPGKAIGASGWTLVRLRLDGFYLVADVTDDDGVERILSTKK